MQKIVSIIIPVYNSQSYLKRCLDSIVGQSFKEIEILLIDDGSTDNSGEICDNYANIDSRIKVYHKSNGGVSNARNFGIDRASGEWICFVDSDDWIDKDYCLNLLSATTSPSSFVMTRHNFIGKKIDKIKECHDIAGEERIDYIISNKILDYSGPYCKLFNKNIIRENKIYFPEKIHMGEDGIFFTRYLNATKYLTVLDMNNYNYQDNGESLSHRFYDFESEYRCYLIWKKEIEKLLYEKKWENEINYKKAVWNNRIGDTFLRSIICLSRQKDYSVRHNYQCLQRINTSDWSEFKKYYSPNTKQRTILKNLLKLNSTILDTILIHIDRLVNYRNK